MHFQWLHFTQVQVWTAYQGQVCNFLSSYHTGMLITPLSPDKPSYACKPTGDNDIHQLDFLIQTINISRSYIVKFIISYFGSRSTDPLLSNTATHTTWESQQSFMFPYKKSFKSSTHLHVYFT